jgi:uncharacterized protein YbaR (Trm112 family)
MLVIKTLQHNQRLGVLINETCRNTYEIKRSG